MIESSRLFGLLEIIRGLPDLENWEARTLTGGSELEIIG
jgi:hypothetical protein